MNVLKSIDKALTRGEEIVLIALLPVMVVMSFLQVVLRNIFSSGILWSDILLRHILLWLGFLGAAIATSENRHINIDALRRFLSPKIRTAMEVVTESLCRRNLFPPRQRSLGICAGRDINPSFYSILENDYELEWSVTENK